MSTLVARKPEHVTCSMCRFTARKPSGYWQRADGTVYGLCRRHETSPRNRPFSDFDRRIDRLTFTRLFTESEAERIAFWNQEAR